MLVVLVIAGVALALALARTAAGARPSGHKVEYCVDDQKTVCETTANTRLIQGRITAAIEALAKAAQG